MEHDDCFFFGAQKWDNHIRSQSYKKDFQSKIPRAPSIDNLFLLDSIKNNDFFPTASQMRFDFASQIFQTQNEKSQPTKSTQRNPSFDFASQIFQTQNEKSQPTKSTQRNPSFDFASQIFQTQNEKSQPTKSTQRNPFETNLSFLKPSQEEKISMSRKKSINKERSNIPIGHKKLFSIPYKRQLEISPENIVVPQFEQKKANPLLEKNFSADDDLFEDVNLQEFPQKNPTFINTPHNSKLKSVKEIPSKFRDIFQFEYFNSIQSKIVDDALYSDRSLVVCAPTGAGKTVIFELAIIRLLLLGEELAQHDFKAVYMAPIKALCSERYQDWQQKLEGLGIHCLELTGDTELDDCSIIQTTNIIITTPEKWDSMTRRWHCDNTLIQNLQLFMIDEVHTLNDSQRGATMEAVISRMKTIHFASKWISSNQSKVKNSIRFIAVSATIPNLVDIAKWLGEPNMSATNYCFDDSHRPVKLKKIVLGYPCSDRISDFQFDISLRYKLHNVITTYSEGKPTLVFCSTRKGVIQAADMLCKNGRFINSSEMKEILCQYAHLLKDSKLKDFVMKGVGCHHAGMDTQDRKYITRLFENGNLLVLLATTTLAMGVNLPAHLVVIMSTQHYAMGNHQEYSESQILQMIGRAGRPQFDTSATAVIMTKINLKHKYEILLDGKQLIESSLHKNLIEHLNAEIFLNTINDISVAVEWIKHTFLYIRVRKNPAYYGISSQMTEEQLEKYLQDLCLRNLNNLSSINLIKMDEDNFDIKPLDLGKVMARYCIAFNTMKRLSKATGTEDINELLNVLSGSSEFMDIQLRINEKKILNSLNKDKSKPSIRFPMKEKIKTKEMKINCLIQASLGCLPIQDFSLSQDVNKIFRSGQRITRCLFEILWMKDSYNGLLNAVYLCKCFRAKIWENSKYVTKQLDGIGQFLSNALVNFGITTFEKFEQTDPREIELITNRHPPFGNQLKSSVAGLPKYKLTVEQNPNCGKTYAEIEINLTISNTDQMKENSLLPDTHTCALIIANADNEVIYKRKIMDKNLLKENGFSKLLHVKKANNGDHIYINLISFEFVGIDIVASFTPMFLKDKTDKVKFNTSTDHSTESQNPEKAIKASVNTSCQHRCHNKKECAHQCCKTGFKNAKIAAKRKQIPEKSSAKSQSQLPESKNINDQNTIHSYIDGLKEKMKKMTDTPTIKRLKVSNTTQKVIDLKQFAFCPKPKIHVDIDTCVPEGLPPTTNITPLIKQESNQKRKYDLSTIPSGWNNLDIYHKTREKFSDEQDVNFNEKMEETFSHHDYSLDEMPFLNDLSNEDLYGDFSLELPMTTQAFNKTNNPSLPFERIRFSDDEDSFAKQPPSPQPSQQHKYGQVLAWVSQDSPRHPFQKSTNSQHNLTQNMTDTTTNGFKSVPLARMNNITSSPDQSIFCLEQEQQNKLIQKNKRNTSDLITNESQLGSTERTDDSRFPPVQSIFCSEQELQNNLMDKNERLTQADNVGSFDSIFDGIF